jgi:hypothetical protein
MAVAKAPTVSVPDGIAVALANWRGRRYRIMF